MVPVGLLLHMITLFLWSSTFVLASKAVPITKHSGCSSQCGDVQIPYPFGIEEGCAMDEWFQMFCNNYTCDPTGNRSPTLSLNPNKLNLQVLNISLEGTIQVKNDLTFFNSSGCLSGGADSTIQPANLSGSPFVYSQKNIFTAVGCGGYTGMTLRDGSDIGGCKSTCHAENITTYGSCIPGLMNCCHSNDSVNCCERQAIIPPELTAFNYTFEPKDNKTTNCKYAFLKDPDWDISSVDITSPVAYTGILLDWKLNSTVHIYGKDDSSTNCTSPTQCSCSQGYQGNPYLETGCQKLPKSRPSWINVVIIVISCVVGLLFLHIGAWWSHKVIKKRINIKRKQKFFKKNGGLLLQQQSSSYETGVETIKLFNSEELEKATNNFDADRILGRGGQGTVYKGMLADGKIIAVKMSLLDSEDEVRQFINEIVILSQIIHRNVVKLLGCCLETEVPLLVYEFISNGTLSHYIQHEDEDFPLTWEMRLRVAIEVAGALSYLHSSASAPIYHRDIKSSNILLDDKYRVKVADFGTSRSVSIDKTHLTMSQVQGTFGYLDPEYFQTSQFTDKSDVYSFGIVLAELLTGKKPIFQTKSEEAISLSNYLLVSLEENCLFDILDARVMNSGKQEIMAVANLAKRCLNLKGRKRPTMRDVAVELEGILFQLQGSKANYDVERNTSEVGYVRNRKTEVWDVGSTSVRSSMVSESSGTTGSSFDTHPLVSIKTE